MKHRRDKPDASRRYHDRVARKYDAIYDDPYWEFHDRLTWEAIKPWLPRDLAARCCDLGCGTGKWGARLLKSGFATTFLDQSGAMIEKTRGNLSNNQNKATLLVGDIVDMPMLNDGEFSLVLAMGDPLSICSDATRAVREMSRITAPGGVIVASADNKLAALDYYLQRNDVDELESFLRTGRTHWLTENAQEQFELTTWTPSEFGKLFERNGLEVVKITGKPILPVRQFKLILELPDAFERLLRMEIELAKDSSAAGRAAHLQIVARRPV